MEQSINSDLIRGHIDTIILKSLVDGDKFAQEISDFISSSSNNCYNINQATLYSSLKRLETTKLLRAYWQDSNNGRRKFFSLTQLGKECVEKKLIEWSRSREIIDDLMGTSSGKVIYVSRQSPVQNVFPSVSPIEIQTKNENSLVNYQENKQLESDKITIKEQAINNKDENEIKDVNYKSILGGLIYSTAPKKESNVIDSIVSDEKIVKTEELELKPKFNETINATEYNTGNLNNNGKIDFGDLALKAAKEGYKLRISSKDSAKAKNGVLINKLNVLCAWLVTLLLALELIIVNFSAKTSPAIYLFLLTGLFPLALTIKYLFNPNKIQRKKVTKDTILISLIVIFNLILVTCALNFFLDVNMFDFNVIVYSLILPVIIFFDGFIFYVLRFNFSKSKKFNIK